MNASIPPFRISITDSKLETLKAKLPHTTFPDDVPMSNRWEFGPPLSDLKRLVSYWKDGFDWRAQERAMNQLPHFTTAISVEGFDELDIHFIHKTSNRKGSVPLLFCHGWPGSFLEVSKILPLLTDPEDDNEPSFHVVAPSLPNFGFSDAPTKPGFNIVQYAECLDKLMLKLGYEKYVTQGGDWGYAVTRIMGAHHPEHCIASHLNYIRADPPTMKQPFLYLQYLLPRSKAEKAGLARVEWFAKQGMGYNMEQTTRPVTIGGAALADSPLGLPAWIYEKLHDWTDAYLWTDDEILTWVSLYWFSTAGPAASARIY
ncbi:hypothetical protein OQA88_2943 [Cercophora sp. LCS_1]